VDRGELAGALTRRSHRLVITPPVVAFYSTSAALHHFSPLSTTFRHFPPLSIPFPPLSITLHHFSIFSTTFHRFPPLSTAFCSTFHRSLPLHSAFRRRVITPPVVDLLSIGRPTALPATGHSCVIEAAILGRVPVGTVGVGGDET